MPRPLAGLALTLGLVALAPADDTGKKPAAKPPTWAGYVPYSTVELLVKSATETEVEVIVPGAAVLSRSGSYRSPRLYIKQGKPETVTLTFHEDGVVRWAKLPPKVDARGKKVSRTLREVEGLKLPRWATGYAADRSDLTVGQAVELVLLRPKALKPDELRPADLRIKQATILTDPQPLTTDKKKDEKKEEKK